MIIDAYHWFVHSWPQIVVFVVILIAICYVVGAIVLWLLIVNEERKHEAEPAPRAAGVKSRRVG